MKLELITDKKSLRRKRLKQVMTALKKPLKLMEVD
jgi:hypothetical protein